MSRESPRIWNRRTVMKSIGTATLTTGVSGAAFLQPARADTPDNQWHENDHDCNDCSSDANDCFGKSQGTSLAYFGATWIDARDAWEHNFRIVTTGSSRTPECRKGYSIDAQKMTATSSASDIDFWDSTDSKYFGIWPVDNQDSFDYTDFAFEVAKTALSELTVYADFAITVYDLMDALTNTNDVSISDGVFVNRDYGIFNTPADIGHYSWMLIDKSGTNWSEAVIESILVNGSLGENTKVGFDVYLSGGESPDVFPHTGAGSSSPSSSSDTGPKTSNPRDMSPKYRKKLGVHRIPPGQARQKARELGLPPMRAAEAVRENEPLYYANRMPVAVQPRSGTSD